MDSKSLAKSKRSHSLHHKKHHPNHKAKGATSTSAVPPSVANDRPLGKVVVKEKARAGPAALPSNWDRYEDDDDPMVENQMDAQTGQPSEVVMPKSKGADYRYLISEAKSQNSTRLSSEFFPSLDDFVSDFDQGKDLFFTVRGESLLSSIQNDCFLVEDKTPANYEASFLSLNMQALANQLTQIDLPKRLFMEADLFPPVQHSEKFQERRAYDLGEVTPSTTTATENSTQINPTMQQPTPNPDPVSVASSIANQSKSKTEAAELELDMLLDSLDDVNLKEKESPSSSTLSSKKTTLDFDIDGTLDDLLKETSTPSLLDQSNASQTPRVSIPEPLDDFDSWLDTI